MSKILFINPPDYTCKELLFHAYNSSVYRVASYYQKLGHDVEVLNMRPEFDRYFFDVDPISFKNGAFYFKGHKIQENVKLSPCGNWNNEHISKPIIRVGLPIDLLIKKLIANKYTNIMISSMFTYLWEGVREVINTCRMFSPTSKITLGGIYSNICREHAISLKPDEIAESNIDISFSKLNLKLWKDFPLAVDLLTGLGCPKSCGYCAVPTLEGNKHIRRDPIEVVGEIEEYIEQGIGGVRFLDSNILWNYETHFKIILETLLERGLHVEYAMYGGVDLNFLTYDILDKMAKLGFKEMDIPVESTSKDLLSRWHRSLDAKRWKEKVTAFKDINIELRSYVLCGCLGQSTADIEATISFVEECGLRPNLLFFTPIPGTPEWKTCLPFIRNKTLDQLNPLLFPLASPLLPVKDLNKFVRKYVQYTLNEIVQHPKTCKESFLETVKVGENG